MGSGTSTPAWDIEEREIEVSPDENNSEAEVSTKVADARPPFKEVLLADLESQLADARTNQTIPLFLSPLEQSVDGEMISPVERQLKCNHSPIFVDVKALTQQNFADVRTQLRAQLLEALRGKAESIDKDETNDNMNPAGSLLVLQLVDSIFDFKKYLCDEASFPLETFDPVNWKTGLSSFLSSSNVEEIGANFQVVITSTLSAVDDVGKYLEAEKPFGSAAPIQVIAVNPVDLANVPGIAENTNTDVKQDSETVDNSEKDTSEDNKQRLSLQSRKSWGKIRASISEKAPERRMSFKCVALGDMEIAPLPGKKRPSTSNKGIQSQAELTNVANQAETAEGAGEPRKSLSITEQRPSVKMRSNPSPRVSLKIPQVGIMISHDFIGMAPSPERC